MAIRKARTPVALPPSLERKVQVLIAEYRIPPELHDVLRCCALGMSIEESAAATGLARNTVRAYRPRLWSHLRPAMGSQPQLMAYLLAMEVA